MPFVPPTKPEGWTGGIGSVAIVGEAPGETEVNQGKPFVGRSGELLSKELARAGISRDTTYVTNAVLCRPPGNKMALYPEAVQRCRPRLIAELKEAAPQKVVSMGGTAMESLLPDINAGILATRGLHTHSDEIGADIIVTTHPAFLLYMPAQMQNFRLDLGGVWDERNEIPDTQYEIITDVETLLALPNRIMEETVAFDPMNEDGLNMTVDTETGTLKPWARDPNARLLCIQISWEPGKSVIIHEDLLRTPECRDVMREIFSWRGAINWWGHNLGFDYIWMTWYDFNPPKIWMDTFVMHYLADESPGGHGLKVIGRNILGVEDWETDLKRYVPKKEDSYTKIPKDVLHRYAARDTDINLRIISPISRMLDDSGWDAYRKVMQPAQHVLADMEMHGLLLDVERLEGLLSTYKRKQNDMLYYLQQMTWAGFNPDSPQQVARKLFEEDGLPVIKKTKITEKGGGGNPSTDDEVLEELMLQDPDNKFLKLLDEYRSISKIIGTYLEGMLRDRDANDVLHPDFNITGTVTGRLTAGIYLTLPRVTKNKWAGPIRDLIIARPGHLIVGGDYNQAEMRVMACESEETVLRDIWLEGRNLHEEMEILLFGTTKKEDYEAYMIAKMFTFGLGYGRGAPSIAKQLKWSVAKATTFHEKYMNAIPRVKTWQNWIRSEIRTVGQLETAFGRKRRFPLLTEKNFHAIANEALNFIPQSTANDLALMSMTEYAVRYVHEKLGRPVLMLHDGIYLEVPEDGAEEAGIKLKAMMEAIPAQKYSTFVPFTAEIKVGKSWGAAEREED